MFRLYRRLTAFIKPQQDQTGRPGDDNGSTGVLVPEANGEEDMSLATLARTCSGPLASLSAGARWNWPPDIWSRRPGRDDVLSHPALRIADEMMSTARAVMIWWEAKQKPDLTKAFDHDRMRAWRRTSLGYFHAARAVAA